MKKTITTIIICLSMTMAFGQTKESAVKKEPVDTTYILGGNFPDFQLLYKAVISPGDVTPNEMKALAAWIQKVKMVEVPKKKN